MAGSRKNKLMDEYQKSFWHGEADIVPASEVDRAYVKNFVAIPLLLSILSVYAIAGIETSALCGAKSSETKIDILGW